MGCAASTTHGVVDGSLAANKAAALAVTNKESPRVHKSALMKGRNEPEESERLLDRRTVTKEDGDQGRSEPSKDDAASEGKPKPDTKKSPDSQLSRVIEYDEEIPNSVIYAPEPKATAALAQTQSGTAAESNDGFRNSQAKMETVTGPTTRSSQRLDGNTQPTQMTKVAAKIPPRSSPASLPSLITDQKNKTETDAQVVFPRPTAASISALNHARPNNQTTKSASEPATAPSYGSVQNVRSKAKNEFEPAGIPLPSSTAPSLASVSNIRSNTKDESEPAPKSTAASHASIGNVRSQSQMLKAKSDPVGASTAASHASIGNIHSQRQTESEPADAPLPKSTAQSFTSMGNIRSKTMEESEPAGVPLPKSTAASHASISRQKTKDESEPMGAPLPKSAAQSFASISNIRSKGNDDSEPAGVPLPKSAAPSHASISNVHSQSRTVKDESEPVGVPLPKSTGQSFASISNIHPTRTDESEPDRVPLPKSTAASHASISNIHSQRQTESEPVGSPLPKSTAQSFASMNNIRSKTKDESEPAGVPLPKSTAASHGSISNTQFQGQTLKDKSDPVGAALPKSTTQSLASMSNIRSKIKDESEPAGVPLPKSAAASHASISNIQRQTGKDESEPMPKSISASHVSINNARPKNPTTKDEPDPVFVPLPKSTAASLSSLSNLLSKNPKNKAGSDPAGTSLPKSNATSLASVSNVHDGRMKKSRDNLGSDAPNSSGRKSRQALDAKKDSAMRQSKDSIVSRDVAQRKSKDDLAGDDHASSIHVAAETSTETEDDLEDETTNHEGEDDSFNPKSSSTERPDGKTSLTRIHEGETSLPDRKDSEDLPDQHGSEMASDRDNQEERPSKSELKLREEATKPSKSNNAMSSNVKELHGVSLALSSAQYAASSPNLGGPRIAGSSSGKLDKPLGKVSVSQKHISKYASEPAKGSKPNQGQETSVVGKTSQTGASKSSLSKPANASDEGSRSQLAKTLSVKNASRSGLESASGAYGSRSRSSIRSNSKAANNMNRSVEFGSTNRVAVDLGDGSHKQESAELPGVGAKGSHADVAVHDVNADHNYERDHEAKSLEQIAAEAADEARRFEESRPNDSIQVAPDAVEHQAPSDVKPEDKDYEITD